MPKDVSVGEKVDVRSQQGLRNGILKQFPKPEELARLTVRQRNAVKIGGMGLFAIATRFGVEGDPIDNTKYYLELGRKILFLV